MKRRSVSFTAAIRRRRTPLHSGSLGDTGLTRRMRCRNHGCARSADSADFEARRRFEPGWSASRFALRSRWDDRAATFSFRSRTSHRTILSKPEMALDLERLIQGLPTGYRQVLVLHDIEGHTHEEIASLLDIEPGTSKSQLSRARRLLRHWLDGPTEKSS